ncbi:adhesion G protein-coupled receptor L2, partial [Biomphalaria glabrata]
METSKDGGGKKQKQKGVLSNVHADHQNDESKHNLEGIKAVLKFMPLVHSKKYG